MANNGNIEEPQGIIGLDLGKYGLSYLRAKHITTWTETEIDKLIDAFVEEDIAPMVLIPFQLRNIKLLLSQSYCRRCGRCCTSNNFTVDDPGVMAFEEELKQIAKYTKYSYKQLIKKSTKKVHPERNDVRYLPLTCIFYEKGKCTIYDIRPFMCKIYPIKDTPPSNGKVHITISVRCEYGRDIYKSTIVNQKNQAMSRLAKNITL